MPGDRPERRGVAQGAQVVVGRLRVEQVRPAVEGAAGDPPQRAAPQERGDHRPGQVAEGAQRTEDGQRVRELPGLPEPGGGQRRGRRHAAGGGEFEGEQAAERVAGHVRLVQPVRGEEGGHDRHGVRHVENIHLRRAAEPGQVHGDHVVALGEAVDHRRPGLPAVADPVQQDQRRTGAAAFVDNLHVTGE